jgi:hypothetical protein
MAVLARGRTIIRTITARSFWIPMVTTSRRFATRLSEQPYGVGGHTAISQTAVNRGLLRHSRLEPREEGVSNDLARCLSSK